MATTFNTTVKLYAGVPLVKGGTDVLLLTASAAEGVLASKLVGTYTAYYFERENRRYIQIDDVFGSVDSVNYISFANNSHGGKIYFGFVDQVVYINDHNTQIEFTIDPFPTFYGDAKRLDEFFVIRNTPRNDIRGQNLEDDYLPKGVKNSYNYIWGGQFGIDRAVVVYAAQDVATNWHLYCNSIDTGLKAGYITDNLLQAVLDHGGSLISAFVVPDFWNIANLEIVQYKGTLATIDLLAYMGTYDYQKLRTGVYHSLILSTPSGTKTYDIEEFDNISSVQFDGVACMFPTPTLYIYPRHYRGVDHNTGEAMTISAPAIPISAAPGYTERQFSSDVWKGIGATISGAISGAAAGGIYGAIGGAVLGGVGGIANMAFNNYMAKFSPPSSLTNGPGVIASDRGMHVGLYLACPSAADMNRIEAYFDYYGYNVNHMVTKTQAQLGQLNTGNNAFLQTGTPFVAGSEEDDELNRRFMGGVKIRTDLSFAS